MRAVFLIIFAILSSGLIRAEPAKGDDRFTRVVLDPGHGGRDPGSTGFGLLEKHLTLDLAERIEKILSGKGFSVELTRRSDEFVDFEERARIANREPNTILVSLHFNAHTDRSISGTETLYWPGSESGRELASYVQSELGRRLVTRNRGFRPERLKVLELSQSTGILIECGFISNRWENQRCGAVWFRQILAEEIVQGLLRYRDS